MSRMTGAIHTAACRSLVNEDALLARLVNEKFDVLLTENFDYCGIGERVVLNFISKRTHVRSLTCYSTKSNMFYYFV